MNKTIHSDVHISVISLVLAFVMYLRLAVMPKGAATFPRLVIILFVIFTLVILYKGIQKTMLMRRGETTTPSISFNMIKLPLMTFLIIMIYTIAIKYIGFFVSTTVFTIGFMYFYQIRDWKKIALTVIGINVFVYLLFIMQLHVPLPQGILY